ncbi:MAG: YtfJ family protein [Syntrophales bacterium]|nr:YtfJ family protein [Syntrophales bacterium]
MKKIFFTVLLVLLWTVSGGIAGDLKVGDSASDWSLPDTNGTMYTMQNWSGKVLLVNYTDPDEKDMNEHFTDAMKKANDDGLLNEATYTGIGIADCKASWKPDALIRSFGAAKAEKYKTVILFDYDASLRNAWGLREDSANAILLDKNGVCRAIVRGRVPDDQVTQLVQLAIDLQRP